MVLKDKKTKITFHNGVMSIGGTLIEVAYGQSRVFFDFGTLFRPELALEDEKLPTLIQHGLAPDLKHVYDERIYSSLGDNPFVHEAIFISHAHLDHTRMLNYSRPDIPMYALKEAACLIKQLNQENDFLLPLAEVEDSYTREIIGLDNQESVAVGDIKVQILRVDHDTIGSAGLKIQTPDLLLAYTGDYRMHGLRPEDNQRFAQAVEGADVLITEGVSVSFEDRKDQEKQESSRPKTEEELSERLHKILRENPDKQISFNAYEANPDRFISFINNGVRDVVLSSYQAQILKRCLKMDVLYYNDKRASIEGLDKDLEVSLKTLMEDEGQYLWQYQPGISSLKGGGVYIHSDATPLGAFDPAYNGFVNGFKEKNIEFIRLGCSGHAYPDGLVQMIDWVKPKILIPIHTLNPEFFENPYGICYLVENKEVI